MFGVGDQEVNHGGTESAIVLVLVLDPSGVFTPGSHEPNHRQHTEENDPPMNADEPPAPSSPPPNHHPQLFLLFPLPSSNGH